MRLTSAQMDRACGAPSAPRWAMPSALATSSVVPQSVPTVRG